MDFDRPVLKKVDVELGDLVTVTVALEAAGVVYEGHAQGVIDEAARARVVGEATLGALASLVGSDRFELAAVGTTRLDDVTVALVQVVENDGDASFVGSAMVRRGDTVLATARAVLDALNRRLALLH